MIFLVFFLNAKMAWAGFEGKITSFNAEHYINELESKLSKNLDVIIELNAMGIKDQYARAIAVPMLGKLHAQPKERQKFLKVMKSTIKKIDLYNTRRLKEILKNYTWTDIAVMGRDATEAAYSIVQHSNDNPWQIEVLKKVKPLIVARKMKGFHLANLTDRVAVNSNADQIYGTQTFCKNGVRIPYPISNIQNVDKRRAEIGLRLTLKNYIKQVQKAYGKCPS